MYEYKEKFIMLRFLIVCPMVFLAGFVDAIGGGKYQADKPCIEYFSVNCICYGRKGCNHAGTSGGGIQHSRPLYRLLTRNKKWH